MRDKESAFVDFINRLKKNDNTLTTIEPVAVEFIKGADTLADVQEKEAFLEAIIETYVPVRHEPGQMRKMAALYRKEAKALSITDFHLATLLENYSTGNTYLLTRDHGDFPMKLFERIAAVPISLERGDIHTYVFYQYSKEKSLRIMEELNKIDSRRSTPKSK